MKQWIKLTFILLFFATASRAQNFGNEWIDYSKRYLRFPVLKEGIYKIDYNTLSNGLQKVGVQINSVDPYRIKIYGRGKEIPLYVEGQGDQNFNANDYILFHANKNDGWLDSTVYDAPGNIVNPYYSLFNDTAYYFVTWDGAIGKRMTIESSTNYTNYTAPSFFIKDTLTVFSTYYNNISEDPYYTQEDGWMESPIYVSNNVGSALTKTLAASNIYTGSDAPDATIRTNVIGASDNIHHFQLDFSGNGSTFVSLADETFHGLEQRRYSFSVPTSTLTNTNSLRFSTLPLNGTTGRLSFSYISFRYPHIPNMEGKNSVIAYLPGTSAQKFRFDFSNLGAGTGSVYCFDITSTNAVSMAVAANSGSGYQVLLPSSGTQEKKVIVVSETGIQKITNMEVAGNGGYFTDLTLGDSDYLIITHPILMGEANSYKTFRESALGGSYKVLVANVNELYDQFAYGIRKNPLAIRHFVNYAATWVPKPKAVFLIGKGAYSNYVRQSPSNYNSNLVPSFGYPPSDIALATHKDSLYTPLIPIGRLAAKATDDVAAYKAKIEDFEARRLDLSEIELRDWTKHVLHFGGGSETSEQQLFFNYLEQYRSIIEDTLFAGKVHTFLKTSAAPIQITVSDSIRKLIDGGVAVMNFFGHASGSSFDQSIDDPESYKNSDGKYPLIIANSCFVGDIHQSASITATGTSEKFVLVPERGAIGFIAQVGLGYAHELFYYNQQLLKQLFQIRYGRSVGESMKETIRLIGTNSNGGYLRRASCLGMTLHGDPMLTPLVQDKPDIALHSQYLSFNPSVVTAETDSVITVNVTTTNLGRALAGSFSLKVTRTFPDNSTETISVTVDTLNYQKEISIRFPVRLVKAAGMNYFEVIADFDDQVSETNENNNKLSVPLYIRSSAIIPVFPYSFSIVPSDTVTLKASTGDPFASARNYRFEIDTTAKFNSSWKKSQVVYHSGGVIPAAFNKWTSSSGSTFTLLLDNIGDSTVYYWRVSPDTAGTSSNALWKSSSFQHIEKKRGWEQAHLYQFPDDGYRFLSLDVDQRKFSFSPNQVTLRCQSIGNPTTYQDLYSTYYKLDAEMTASGGCQAGPAIHIAVIDSTSLQPWEIRYMSWSGVMMNPNHGFDNTNDLNQNCSNGTKVFIFHLNNPTEMQGLSRMLDSVPNGNYFLAYSFYFTQGGVPAWADPTVKQKLVAMGFNGITGVPPDFPFILFMKKGYPSTKKESYGTSALSSVTFDTTLVNTRTYGEITSSLIGPATSWDSAYWNLRTTEVSGDRLELQVLGIGSGGDETILYRSSSLKDGLSLSTVSASTYPYLKLRALVRDSINNTPLQLDRWHVVYAPVPEAAVDPSKGFSIEPSNPQEGSDFILKVPVENISDIPMDSIAVRGFVQDKNRNQTGYAIKKYKPLAPGESVMTEVSMNTRGFGGSNLFWLEANPLVPGTQYFHQPEQHHFNNFAHVQLNVATDKENPLLDVTFDGVHILNGDIVSPKPEIMIQLKDENKYLLLDTSDYTQVFIKYPEEETERLLQFDNNSLRFFKATSQNNKCKIVYSPEFEKDGVYELRVQARDASRNESGILDYRITFEVINKSMITQVMNYPNPFSTSTKFVFTLTGSVVPSYFKIQIMTITGKVVKEIEGDELGPIHIGRNITEYSWDGKDEFGDQLANGVYFYRVVTKINGENIERLNTGADQYFHKGIGKMYLMR